MLIRKMNNEDIQEVIKCETKIFGETLGISFYTDENIKSISSHYVSVNEKIIIGYIGLWITPPTGQVINFFVIDDMQNKKVGTKLLEKAFDVFKKNNVKTITLEVRESNINAQKIYKSFGFVKSHNRINYYDDGEDAILMLWEDTK